MVEKREYNKRIKEIGALPIKQRSAARLDLIEEIEMGD